MPAKQQPSEPATTSLAEEAARAHERARAQTVLDPRAEIVDNLYPLLRMMLESSGEVLVDHEQRLALAEATIAELALSSDSMLLPDLAGAIDEVLMLGLQVCQAAENGDAAAIAELTVKYRAAVEELRAELADVTVDPEDEDGPNGAEKE
jgi:hypothetical protein